MTMATIESRCAFMQNMFSPISFVDICLLEESMLLTSPTFLIEKRSQKKFHHISKINLFPLSPIATLTALAVKF
jgi:hypothetical protein